VRRASPRDLAGHRIRVNDVTLAESGAVLVSGFDRRGVARMWVGARGIGDYGSLRPVLRESVSFTRPPLDRPDALWATAPQAIWESLDDGSTWHLLISHVTWQHVEVINS
jgi:hypothetical protein